MNKFFLLSLSAIFSFSALAQDLLEQDDLSKLEIVQHCVATTCMIQDATKQAGNSARFITTRMMLKGLMESPELDTYTYEIVSDEDYLQLQEAAQYTFFYSVDSDKAVKNPTRCVAAVVGGAVDSGIKGAGVGAAIGAGVGGTPAGIAAGAGVRGIIGAVGGASSAFGTADACKPRSREDNFRFGH